jgi:hypothetical protein
LGCGKIGKTHEILILSGEHGKFIVKLISEQEKDP